MWPYPGGHEQEMVWPWQAWARASLTGTADPGDTGTPPGQPEQSAAPSADQPSQMSLGIPDRVALELRSGGMVSGRAGGCNNIQKQTWRYLQSWK